MTLPAPAVSDPSHPAIAPSARPADSDALGVVTIWPALGEHWPLAPKDGEGTMEGRPEYAVSATYAAFLAWMREDPKSRARVTYLTAERAEALVGAGAAKGVLHRLGGWETSPAREAAERLEG